MAAAEGEVKPRSRRVGTSSPASDHRPSSLIFDAPSPPSSPTVATPPIIPARSPLRPPPPRSVITASSTDSTITPESSPFIKLSTSSSSTEDDCGSASMPSSFQMRNRSLPLLIDEAVVAKPLPLRPESPLTLSPMDDEAASSTSSLGQQPPTTLTKRQHALHELLASERAYASDLALVKEVWIPLAVGQSMLLNVPPISPPHSSASSSRTLSTASDSSNGSSNPPMTMEDAKAIFNNIAELATFSDMFCDSLQEALGSMVEGGTGEDRVGALFLKIVPEMERPYKYYITRQGTADEYLQSLPRTPALEAYFAQTRSFSTTVSHAWDLHSLLIKPVQRLLKYPLLLGTILDETPDSHPDKENLRLAKAKIEDVARNVNEERRRAEVIKGVLTGDKKKASNANISVAASVNLSKIKSLRKTQPLDGGSTEAAKVEAMQKELKKIETFAQQFARDVTDWSKSMNIIVQSLKYWAIGFGKVIGLSEEQGSDAFDAFRMVLEQQLAPLCVELDQTINDKLLKEVATLLATMKMPNKLLESMDEQEPFHYHLLTMNVSAKNRPPPALLEASTNYLALRGQLAKELPRYIELMHRGIALSIRRLTEIQTQFWQDIRDRWGDLWEMLRVDGEMNAGAEETIEVWHSRWADVDDQIRCLAITNPLKIYQDPQRPVVLPPRYVGTPAPPSSRKGSSGSTTNANVMQVLYALDPAHAPQVSMPYPLSSTPPSRGRGRGYSDSKSSTKDSKPENIKSSKASKSEKKSNTKPRPPADDWSDILSGLDFDGWSPNSPIPRTKSMPLPKNVKTSSMSTTASSSSVSSKLPMIDVSPMEDLSFFPAEDDRGRHVRKPSFRRKISETLRSNSSSRHRPSSSKGYTSLDSSTSSSSRAESEALPPAPFSAQMNKRRDSWSSARAKYACRVVHPCKPPLSVSYFSFPFFTLVEGDVYHILQEAGHPSLHPKLPLYVDDGEDCLLLCRDATGTVGWALASFLEPVNLPVP